MFYSEKTDLLSRYQTDFPRIHSYDLVGTRTVRDACGYTILFSYPIPDFWLVDMIKHGIYPVVSHEENQAVAEEEGF